MVTANALHFFDPNTVYERYPDIDIYGERHKYESWALQNRAKPAFSHRNLLVRLDLDLALALLSSGKTSTHTTFSAG